MSSTEAIQEAIQVNKEATDKALETKADKFTRLGTQRVINALDKIRLIGNLATGQYEYTQDQVNSIESALCGAVEHVMNQFNKVKAKEESFRF